MLAVSVSNERGLVSIHSTRRSERRQPHAAKSATYDTDPEDRFQRSPGKVCSNRAADEVSAGVSKPPDRRKRRMVAEATVLHKRSLRESARGVNDRCTGGVVD
jgi:hypothetical protein